MSDTRTFAAVDEFYINKSAVCVWLEMSEMSVCVYASMCDHDWLDKYSNALEIFYDYDVFFFANTYEIKQNKLRNYIV